MSSRYMNIQQKTIILIAWAPATWTFNKKTIILSFCTQKLDFLHAKTRVFACKNWWAWTKLPLVWVKGALQRAFLQFSSAKLVSCHHCSTALPYVLEVWKSRGLFKNAGVAEMHRAKEELAGLSPGCYNRLYKYLFLKFERAEGYSKT